MSNTFDDLSNARALSTPFGRQSLFFRSNKQQKITDKIDFVKLANFIKRNYNKSVWFTAKSFIGYRTKTLERTVSSGIDAKYDRIAGNVIKENVTFKATNPIIDQSTGSKRVLDLKAALNTREDQIDLRLRKSNLEFKLQPRDKEVSFGLKIYYSDREISVNNEAIHIYTGNYTDFDLLEQYIGQTYIAKEFKTEIEDQFSMAFSNAKSNYTTLSWLYEVAPAFVLEKRTDKELYEDFLFILEEMSSIFSNSFGVDQNLSVLNILSSIGKGFIFKKFRETPSLLFTILEKLDADYDLAFVSIVTNICYDQWQGGDFKNKNTVRIGSSEQGNYYVYKVAPTIDLFGTINPKGKINFQNIFKRGGPDNLMGIINIWPFRLDPLEPLYIAPTTAEGLWVPAIVLKPFLDEAEHKERIKFYTDILFVVATAGSIKILQSATAPVFLRIIAAVELAKAPIDVAMNSYALRSALAKTEEGKWFVDNWSTISTVVDLTTLGSDFLYTLYRNGPKIAAFFRNKKRKDAADGLDGIVEEVEKHLGDGLDAARAKRRVKETYEHPDSVHNKNNARSKSEVQTLKKGYYDLFGKRSVEKAIKLAENVASSLKVKKEVLVSVMAYGDDFIWKTNIPNFQLKSLVEELTGNPFKKFDLLNINKQEYLNLLDNIYRRIGDKPLHPKLKERIENYFDNLRAGKANVGNDLFERGGKFPGEHAEVRALNELLHKIDPGNTEPLTVFDKIFGVNKNIESGKDMTRCFHCWNITDLVKILFVD